MSNFGVLELVVLFVILCPFVLWFVTLFEIIRKESIGKGAKSDYSFNLFLW